MTLAKRQLIEKAITDMQKKTSLPLSVLVKSAGVPKSTWFEWKHRKGQETKHNHDTPRNGWTTPDEQKAIIGFCRTNKDMLFGYRYLAWLMVDRNIAFVSPATVYNIMKRNDLIHRWARPAGEEKTKGFDQPKAPNEQWHTDISYIKILGVFYYFISVMDGFSRKILVWGLFTSMDGINVEFLIAKAKERYPDANARIIHDNGKQFVSKDFYDLIALLELCETAASPSHPQSNGKLERFHEIFKTEHVRRTAYTGYDDAKEKMARWIRFYNSERLHGAIMYLTPEEVFAGKKEERIAERREKLHTAYINRRTYWQNQYV